MELSQLTVHMCVLALWDWRRSDITGSQLSTLLMQSNVQVLLQAAGYFYLFFNLEGDKEL